MPSEVVVLGIVVKSENGQKYWLLWPLGRSYKKDKLSSKQASQKEIKSSLVKKGPECSPTGCDAWKSENMPG